MEYATWEIIKILYENPSLKFKDTSQIGSDDWVCVSDNVICWAGNSHQPLYVLVGEAELKWTLMDETTP